MTSSATPERARARSPSFGDDLFALPYDFEVTTNIKYDPDTRIYAQSHMQSHM